MNIRSWIASIASVGIVAAVQVPQTALADEDTQEVNVSAEAVPDALTHQGRLIDDDGQPITGDVQLTYTVWDHPTEGAVLWEDIVEVQLDDTGFYSVELGGADNPIEPAVLADGQAWMGVAVEEDEEMEPRISLNAVPYAVIAGEALNARAAATADEADFAQSAEFAEASEFAEQAASVEDGSIGTEALADDFEVEPQHIEDATGETVGGLSCANGDIARFDGNSWECDDEVAHAATAGEAEHADTADEADHAQTADEADHADTADEADFADTADEADHATTADEADHAQTADEADFADTAAVAEGVEDNSIDADSLASGFSVTPGQVDGDTLGGLSCANGDIARFDGNSWFCDEPATGTVTDVTADGPLASSGGTTPNITIAQADSDTDGYLAAADYASFDDRVESVEEGEGISLAGSDASPEVNVEFGDEAGTVTEGDDPRLSDAREPEPGHDQYIQNDPGSAQSATIDIDGDAYVSDSVGVGTDDPGAELDVDGDANVEGDLTVGGEFIYDDCPDDMSSVSGGRFCISDDQINPSDPGDAFDICAADYDGSTPCQLTQYIQACNQGLDVGQSTNTWTPEHLFYNANDGEFYVVDWHDGACEWDGLDTDGSRHDWDGWSGPVNCCYG